MKLVSLVISTTLLVLWPSGHGANASEPEILVVGGEAVVSAPLADHLQTCTNASLGRLAGANRYETAANVSSHWATAETVFLATGLAFPDAIAAGPVAGLNGAPMLLVERDGVPSATAAELARLAPSRVVLLGGPEAISPTVEEWLTTRHSEVIRLSGADRYGTAAAISSWQFPAGAEVVYVSTGTDFRDALTAGSTAVRDKAPMLLVAGTTVPPSTMLEVRRLSPRRIVIVGGLSVVSSEVEQALETVAPVERLAGNTLSATGSAAAQDAPGSRTFIATADDFPDALAALPLANGAPVLLVRGSVLEGPTAVAIARRTGVDCEPWAPPYPAAGSGKRIIYSNSDQQVWLIDENERLVDTYPVSGRRGIPFPGTYSVYSKSPLAWAGHDGITMRHMARFVPPGVSGNRLAIGFHGIPRYANGDPMQSEEELGTFQSSGCVRQSDDKAEALYTWADIGTTVIVLP